MTDPFVSVSITHHTEENEKYLNVCLKSVLNSVGVDYEVIVLSDAERAPSVPAGVKLIHDKGLNTSTKKTEYYLDNLIHPKAKCCLFLSNDTMITKYSMHNMAETAMTKNAIVGPLSNGDILSNYLTDMNIYDEHGQNPIKLKVEMDLEEIQGRENILMNYNPTFGFLNDENKLNSTGRFSHYRNWFAFHTWLAPRFILDSVGKMDPRLDCRFSDVDYAARVQRKGYGTFVEFTAYALHFANKSLKPSTSKEKYLEASTWYYKKMKEINEI